MEKIWYFEENYNTVENNFGTIPKNMIKYRKLWNYDLLLKQYGIMEKN